MGMLTLNFFFEYFEYFEVDFLLLRVLDSLSLTHEPDGFNYVLIKKKKKLS